MRPVTTGGGSIPSDHVAHLDQLAILEAGILLHPGPTAIGVDVDRDGNLVTQWPYYRPTGEEVLLVSLGGPGGPGGVLLTLQRLVTDSIGPGWYDVLWAGTALPGPTALDLGESGTLILPV